ncbi:polysaccharide deacetylase family protein [Brevibacillus daliensis]|uniref:polysaccharide deacetylase family protein n=1 Tax=Brevibacillus daliensis TaxID=2892995 RepID=UPI001E3929BC|nr:polysaccharide deacetylase family protein [Brevibacillus daliensis]
MGLPYGAFVISLDFELHWGVRDYCGPNHPYNLNLLHSRRVVPRLLDIFEQYNVEATWAIVGSLFAENREHYQRHLPTILPSYSNIRLFPYSEDMGEGEWDDPLHYASSLIKLIKQSSKQEIGTHTYSHYYCLEKGQTKEMFASDLKSAMAIAKDMDIQIRSIVFPRNQHNPAYDKVLLDHGILCYRGNPTHPAYHIDQKSQSISKRIYRLSDSYWHFSGSLLHPWDKVVDPSGLCNVAGSRFFRPYQPYLSSLETKRLELIKSAIQEAARTRQIFHLWWNPHNFGNAVDENFYALIEILEEFKRMHLQFGMQSLSMYKTAQIAKEHYRPKQLHENKVLTL